MKHEINLFAHKSTDEFKQETYQMSKVKEILRAYSQRWKANPSHYFSQFRWYRDNPSSPMNLLMKTYPGLPVMLGAIRPKQVTLHQLIGENFQKLEIWQELMRVQATYADWPAHGVVFDVHGDGIADLVVHTLGEIPSRFTLKRTQDDTRLYICEFSALLDHMVNFSDLA